VWVEKIRGQSRGAEGVQGEKRQGIPREGGIGKEDLEKKEWFVRKGGSNRQGKALTILISRRGMKPKRIKKVGQGD